MQGNWSAAHLSPADAELVAQEWFRHARPSQYPVALMGMMPDIWLVLGGRGAGKTRLGAEWVNGLVRGLAPFSHEKHSRLALIGETLADVRDVMIEGPSGIVGISRHDRPRFEASRRRLVWDNGAVATVFSSEDPDSLRGHQFEAAWCDEAAKWRYPEACFDMLQFGLRLGARPRQIVTTTPRPTALIKRLLADPSVAVTRMRTEENAANLAPGFLKMVERRYGGTRLGRQELDGELIEDREDALWSRRMIEEAALDDPGALARIVVAVDPPASSRRTSDACGIVAAGLGDHQCRQAAGMGGSRRDALSPAAGRLPGGRGQPGWRDGDGGDPHGRPGRSGEAGRGAARKMAARRAGCRALPAGQGAPRRPLRRTGR